MLMESEHGGRDRVMEDIERTAVGMGEEVERKRMEKEEVEMRRGMERREVERLEREMEEVGRKV